jgi:hypothetical protein
MVGCSGDEPQPARQGNLGEGMMAKKKRSGMEKSKLDGSIGYFYADGRKSGPA